MQFKNIGGRIFGVKLNAKEQKILDEEIAKQLVEHYRKFSVDRDSYLLYMLHTEFGFGASRLRKAWKMLYEDGVRLRKHYELDAEDEAWVCRQKLKEIGVDVEEWYKNENIGVS